MFLCNFSLLLLFVNWKSSLTAFCCFSTSVGWTERSALRALRQQLFVHKSDLIGAFQEFDPNNTGTEVAEPLISIPVNVTAAPRKVSLFISGVISLRHWATATERVLKLGLPWRVLRPQLINRAQHGMVDYQQWIRELSITEPKPEVSSLKTSSTRCSLCSHNYFETWESNFKLLAGVGYQHPGDNVQKPL